MWILAKTLALGIFNGLVIGFLLPFLITAFDHVLIILGVFVTVGLVPLNVWLGVKLYKQLVDVIVENQTKNPNQESNS